MFKYNSTDSNALEVVQKAFTRSFGNIKSNYDEIHIFISPNNSSNQQIQDLLKLQSKVIIFGEILPEIAQLISLELILDDFEYRKSITCLDNACEFNHSEYYISYDQHNKLTSKFYGKRYFTRYDFMNEWNNHGYGRVSCDKSMWSVSNVVKSKGAESLAKVYDSNGFISEFATITDFLDSSVLYINRKVGTVDGLDWGLIENFVSRYRSNILPSAPLILDIPFGYDMVASARLDCDQSVINSQKVVELYKSYNIDISLAISTGIEIGKKSIKFLQDFKFSGGSILSHTVNHKYYWGENYNDVYDEAYLSKKWIEKHIEGVEEICYAVSPFHSNKPYAIEALVDAGYKGFISGIIYDDPEYLIGVSGQVPFTNKKMVTHSQQCMFHGDCYHRYKDSIEPYKESFLMCQIAGKMFGYLDHPFGDYDYGWLDEEERIKAHTEMIEYISSFENVIWMTCESILDFIYDKSMLDIEIAEDGTLNISRLSRCSELEIGIEYKGAIVKC